MKYANITNDHRGILLRIDSAQTHGGENAPVLDAPALLALVASRNVAEVNFAAAWMPRRAVAVGKLTPALLRRYFGK